MRTRPWVGRCSLSVLVLDGPVVRDDDGACSFYSVEPTKEKARRAVRRHWLRGKQAHLRPRRDPQPWVFKARD